MSQMNTITWNRN